MDSVQRALVDAVAHRESEWLDFMRDLVNCDSGTFNKDEADRAGELLSNAMTALGFVVERVSQSQFGDHLIARKPGRGDKRLLFIGHFDTVFPRGAVAKRPFTIAGDRITGPGVYDMKGGLAVLIAALNALAETNSDTWRDASFTVVFNSDEELLSPTSRPIIETEAQRADTICVLEPARPGGEYTFVRKGAGMFRFSVSGRAAHSGGQHELGRSAVEELARKVLLLQEMTNYETGTTVNVGVIQGGERPNVVAASAMCEFDLRVYTNTEAERAERRFREIAETVFVPETHTEFSGAMLFPPLQRQRRNELLFRWVQQAGHTLRLELHDVVSGGGSDGNTAGQFAPLIDGMGVRGDGAHSEREFMHLASLVERAQVLALFLADWPHHADQLTLV